MLPDLCRCSFCDTEVPGTDASHWDGYYIFCSEECIDFFFEYHEQVLDSGPVQ
jgi:hypothetical protein